MLLYPTVHEEDPALPLDRFSKVEEEEMLVPYKEGDEAMEDDAVADGTVVAKADNSILHRPNLAHSVTAVASTDIMHRNVQREPVLRAAVELHTL